MSGLAGNQALIASTTAFALIITKIVDFVRNAFDKNEVLRAAGCGTSLHSVSASLSG